MIRKVTRSFALAAGMALAAVGAQAATFNFTAGTAETAASPIVSGSGNLTGPTPSTSFNFFFGTAIADPLLNAAQTSASAFFNSLASFFSGDYVDAIGGATSLAALYKTDSGAVGVGNFDYFVVEVTGFDTGGASVLDVDNAAYLGVTGSFFEVTSFTPAQVIPLPAGAWLMLSGIGGLVVLRRRQKKAA